MEVDYNALEKEWAIAHKVKLDKGSMRTYNLIDINEHLNTSVY
jgi:hypothetical protein